MRSKASSGPGVMMTPPPAVSLIGRIPPITSKEIYVGSYGNKNGSIIHVILLPHENEKDDWVHQMIWARSIKGHLPNKVECAMLGQSYSNLFNQTSYWSCESHSKRYELAWAQAFIESSQHYIDKSYKLPARAVRRVSAHL